MHIKLDIGLQELQLSVIQMGKLFFPNFYTYFRILFAMWTKYFIFFKDLFSFLSRCTYLCMCVCVTMNTRGGNQIPWDSVQFQAVTGTLTTVCNSSPKGYNTLFCPLEHCTDVAHIQVDTHIQKIKINKISKILCLICYNYIFTDLLGWRTKSLNVYGLSILGFSV